MRVHDIYGVSRITLSTKVSPHQRLVRVNVNLELEFHPEFRSYPRNRVISISNFKEL